jgi:hypothetical protein
MSSSEWTNTFLLIKESHDNAYKTIERAIKLEEQERPDLALKTYKDGVRLIDEALAIPVEVPPNFQKDDNWNAACSMIHKMKNSRAEVLIRIGQLASKASIPIDEGIAATEENASYRPWTYAELADVLKDIEKSGVNDGNLELLFSCDGIKMYYIHSSGRVSGSSDLYTLRIVRIGKVEARKLDSSAFIQVIKTSESIRIENVEEPLFEEDHLTDEARGIEVPGSSFLYPLVAGVSPCFRTDYGAFVLPDLQCTDGSAVGLIIPSGSDEVVVEILTALLNGIVYQEGGIVFGTDSAARIRKRTSVVVSENIVHGAYWLSKGLVKGAEKAGDFFSTYGTPYLKSKLPKAEDGSVEVSSGLKTGIEVAKTVTGKAASATGYIAEKVGSATMAIGRFLAPHVQKHGSHLLSYSTGLSEEEAQEKMSGVLTVCAGAVEGFGEVYRGLEQSAGILGRNLSNNTVDIVEHTYGQEVGQAVGSGLDTVGNVINLGQNVNSMTAKGIAKKTAKNAGKAIVLSNLPPGVGQEANNEAFRAGDNVTATSLYPDLSTFAEVVNKDIRNNDIVKHS